MGEYEVRRSWKDYFEDLCNMSIQEKVAVHMCGFDGIQRGNYFEEDPIRRTEVEVREGKLRDGKAAGRDEVTGEMIKGGGYMVVDWVWKICNMDFENGVVPEDWRSGVVVLLHKGKGERTECKNYREISLLSVVGIYM